MWFAVRRTVSFLDCTASFFGFLPPWEMTDRPNWQTNGSKKKERIMAFFGSLIWAAGDDGGGGGKGFLGGEKKIWWPGNWKSGFKKRRIKLLFEATFFRWNHYHLLWRKKRFFPLAMNGCKSFPSFWGESGKQGWVYSQGSAVVIAPIAKDAALEHELFWPKCKHCILSFVVGRGIKSKILKIGPIASCFF